MHVGSWIFWWWHISSMPRRIVHVFHVFLLRKASIPTKLFHVYLTKKTLTQRCFFKKLLWCTCMFLRWSWFNGNKMRKIKLGNFSYNLIFLNFIFQKLLVLMRSWSVFWYTSYFLLKNFQKKIDLRREINWIAPVSLKWFEVFWRKFFFYRILNRSILFDV